MKKIFSQRKVFFLFALFFIVGGLIIAPKVFSQNHGTKVEFKTPLALSELADFVKKYDLKPTELYFKQANGNGGYVFQKGENIDSAIKNFISENQKFFDIMIPDTEKRLREVKDKKDYEIISVLYKQLTSELEEFKNGKLTIYALLLKDSDAVNKLQKLNLIVSSTPSESFKRKSNAVGKQKDFSIVSTSHESWAPYVGTTDVRRTYARQTFRFNDTSIFRGWRYATYEHETQVYDLNFADFSGYWRSNMPSSYYDTPFRDTIDNFTIGTFRADSFATFFEYYTYMGLRAGTAPTSRVITKGQAGTRPPLCFSTWCVRALATTSSMGTLTAPSGFSWTY